MTTTHTPTNTWLHLPDHRGACISSRPFRLREDGSREYLDQPSADACPPWCTAHVTDGGTAVIHQGHVVVGTADVLIEQIGTGAPTSNAADPTGPYLNVPEIEWANGQEAVDLAAALTEAAELVRGELP